MRPSVRRCSTTRLPSVATWTYTRTAEPRVSGLREPSQTCTGLSPRAATSTGAGAGGGVVWNCNTKSGTIMLVAFHLLETKHRRGRGARRRGSYVAPLASHSTQCPIGFVLGSAFPIDVAAAEHSG